MNMKAVVASLALASGLAGFAASSSPMDAVASVTPGVWSSSFTDAKASADKENVPMLVFWANPGCSQCEKLETACKKADFKAWMAKRQLVFVFGYGTSGADMKACKAFVKNSSGEFPYIGVYWKANTKGTQVYEKFTGRSGKMGHGASSSQDLGDQLMTAVDNILADWVSPDVDPDPDPTPDPDPAVDVSEIYGKAKTLSAVILDAEENYAGTATIKIGKLNARKGTVKVGVVGTLFSGKKVSAYVTTTPEADGSIVGAFQTAATGTMVFELVYDAETDSFDYLAEGEDYMIEVGDVTIGGAFDVEELAFTASFDELYAPDNYDFVVDLPTFEPVFVKNGTKLSVNKAPSIKYKKVDGVYELVGLDDEVKTNLTRLKLTYAYKTGVFKGSFKIYASNEMSSERKPSLKSYTAKVNGVVVNGVGIGAVTVKIGSTTYVGTCTLGD